ncbi:MAG: transcriptional regulator NrdR [Candidatus Dojkabacteria bacterium]
MVCPYCKNEDLRVVDKRECGESSIRRRRECEKCGKRFTSYERIEKVTLNVLKRDGRIEEFDREKLKRGVVKAVKKRYIADDVLESMITEIEHNLMNREEQTIKSVEVGELVLKHLTKIDKLGALLFASVYKEFQSLEDVQKEMERISKKK